MMSFLVTIWCCLSTCVSFGSNLNRHNNFAAIQACHRNEINRSNLSHLISCSPVSLASHSYHVRSVSSLLFTVYSPVYHTVCVITCTYKWGMLISELSSCFRKFQTMFTCCSVKSCLAIDHSANTASLFLTLKN